MDTIDLERRLADLGHHLDAECSHRARGPQPSADHTAKRTPSDRRPAMAAAVLVPALVVVGVVGLVAALVFGAQLGPGPEAHTAAEPAPPPPTAVPEGALAPGQVAPYLDDPPAWFGQPWPGERPAGHHEGNWVSAAIGIVDAAGGVEAPILVSVTDGSPGEIDGATPIEIDGRPLLVASYDTGWNLVATTGQRRIVASGVVEVAVLAALIDEVWVGPGDGDLAFQLTTLPEGYTTLVEPQVRAADPPGRRTLVAGGGQPGHTVINEVSEWVRADLSAAASGADHQAVAVGDVTGYLATINHISGDVITFLAWSPEPGVVLEISTTDLAVPTQELIELAQRVRLVPVDQWDELLDQG